MAVSVSIENLYNWVTSQPLNTVDTPYVLNITWSSRTQKINNLPIDEYDLRRALDESYVYLDLSATTLPAWSTYIGIFFSWSGCLFQNLKALIKTPNFPSNGCTNWSGLFSGCTNLKVVSNIPSNIQVMDSSFSGCTSLTDVPAIPDTVYDLRYTFKNCTSLENAPSIGSGVQTMERSFEGCTSLTNLSSFNSVVTNLLYTFKNCTSLTNVPVYFVANAITLEGTFSGCSSLDWNIILPPTVTSVKEAFKGTAIHNILNIFSLTTNLTNIQSVFEDCQNLSQLAVIPRTVTQMSYAFKNTNITFARLYVNVNDCPQMCEAFANCSNLTYVETNLPIEFFYGNNVVSYLQDVFSGCSSLRQIAIKTISEADWHVFSLKFGQNDVQGTVYDKNGNKTAIPQTSITKSTLRLPILTDEVWFPTGLTDSEIDDTILDMLGKRYGVFNKTVIDPRHKSFVLLADDPSYITTNITRGAVIKQAAFDAAHPVDEIYIQYPTQKAPADLYNVGGVRSTWEDITSEYDGAFFRAYKSGTSKSFADSTVNPNQLSNYKQGNQNAYHRHSIDHTQSFSWTGSHAHDFTKGGGVLGLSVTSGTETTQGLAGSNSGLWKNNNKAINYVASKSITVSGNTSYSGYSGYDGSSSKTESRPDNFAIRIWKRTA